MSRRQCLEGLDDRGAGEAGGQQIGCLTRAHERAGEDLVDDDVEPVQATNGVLEASHSADGQRAFRIVRPFGPPFGSDGVANEVQLERWHA